MANSLTSKGEIKTSPWETVPELAKSATHGHLYRVKQHGTSVTEHVVPALKSCDNLPEGREPCARNPGPVARSPPSTPTALEHSGISWGACCKLRAWSWGPAPGDSDQKRPDPQVSVLRFPEASPTVMVTQNHMFKSSADSFTKLGYGLGKSITALGLAASAKEKI